ncbi:MAG: C4-dicarboxylate TRAP transporter substrate-binding protein [Mesorhizobium sp.]|nr:C4-dicarboxylate TRAP transporter substrate-binding protein [Mesorhizobium sp.]MCO5163673.1 C4-dicarboxylate TRAP transporter substrate-binding protein [Mesorhizobium sp.]
MKYLVHAALASLVLSVSSAAADTYKATMVAGQAPIFRFVKMLDDPFATTAKAKIEALGHSITFTGQYGGSIAGPGEELDAVGAGLGQIGLCTPIFSAAKLPEQLVGYYAPFVTDDTRLAADVVHNLYLKNADMQRALDENNVVYLGNVVPIDDYILMTKFPVKSMEDLKGKKIAAPGPSVNWLSGTGAVAVSANLTTYYNELSTGVYDGVIVFTSAAMPGKFHEVAPYITRVKLGAQASVFLCANKDWYNGLPKDVQDALHAGGAAAMEWYITELEATVEKAYKVMAENGATISEASPELRQAWVQGMENHAKNWAKTLDDKGRPGSAVLAAYMDAMRAAGAKPLRNWDQE